MKTPLLGLAALGALGSLGLAAAGQSLASIVVGIVAGAAASLGFLAAAPLAGAACASLLAAAVSAYLTYQHHDALHGGDSFCNVNETLNCDLVNTSSYSEIGGVPIAIIGMAFYLAVALVALAGLRQKEQHPHAAGLVFAGGVAACAYTVYLAWASATLGAICLFCVSTYVANALILLTGWLALAGDTSHIGAALVGKDGSLGKALTVGIVALAVGTIGYRSLATSTGAAAVAAGGNLGALYALPHGDITVRGDEPVWGKPGAKWTLVEWVDYECPYCAKAAGVVKDLVAKHPDVKVVHKHYPLSNRCNGNVSNAMHENACNAALAAICADAQGRFWELNELMFKNQKYLAPDDLTFMADQVGLDTEALTACMSEASTAEALQKDIADGSTAGIHSTPTMVLVGVHPDGPIVVTQGTDALDVLLSAAEAGETFPPRQEERGHAH